LAQATSAIRTGVASSLDAAQTTSQFKSENSEATTNAARILFDARNLGRSSWRELMNPSSSVGQSLPRHNCDEMKRKLALDFSAINTPSGPGFRAQTTAITHSA
jgi:hypothetical protein